MKVSHSWLQTYFKEKIPSAEKLAELFTFHAFEVEDVAHVGEDAVIDVKILPDRAHYALSHLGIAREIAAITGLTLKHKEILDVESVVQKDLTILIVNTDMCRRYVGRRVGAVSVGDSPAWLQERLEAIGQRSINTIVDATNFVMHDIGQPLHAFDADKVAGGIVVRKAMDGEKITTLDGREVNLDQGMLVIADDSGPLTIAGVKGGSRAAVTAFTKNIIIESANFEPTTVRKTSTKVGIRNDSSKRFENEISPELAGIGMKEISALIHTLSPHAEFGEIVDIYPAPAKPWTVTIAPEYISSLLGLTISEQEIVAILNRLHIKTEKQNEELVLAIPYWRLDLTAPQDIAEEVGRIYGYEKIPAAMLPPTEKQSINKTFYWIEKIKDILAERGYSEIMAYSLVGHGSVEIQNPLASDKGFLRDRLYEGIEKALAFNSRNAALLGQEEIKIFEIGSVFTEGEREETYLAIGYFSTKNIKNKEKAGWELVENLVKEIGGKIGAELKGVLESSEAGIIFEMSLTKLIELLPAPEAWDISENSAGKSQPKKYKAVSPYPFATRDIAAFVPEGVSQEKAEKIIIEKSGSLLVRADLFDVFTKTFPDTTKKTSYAFRLVFQSQEKTLAEDEINSIMKSITDEMNSQDGWQVR